MLQLCATVLLSMSCHRYCHVYCRPYVSSVGSHREPSSLSSLEYRTAQVFTHRRSRRDAPRRDVVRKTQSLSSKGAMIREVFFKIELTLFLDTFTCKYIFLYYK